MADSELHRFVYDLIADHAHFGSGADADEAIAERGLQFEYRLVTSLGSFYCSSVAGIVNNRNDAEANMAREKLYIDSLRNTAPEFRQARISALRIERRIVGAWE